MIPANVIAEITKPHEDPRTDGGLIVRYECIATHEGKGNALWTLWRAYIGPTRCGCDIRCAIIRAGGTWEVETEKDGFTGVDCPVKWLSDTKTVDRAWRDRVWVQAEKELAAKFAGKDGAA